MTILTSKKISPATSSLPDEITIQGISHHPTDLQEKTIQKIRISMEIIDNDRKEKIEKIKEMIKSGKYHVDASDIANAMLKDLIKLVKM